MCIDTNQIRNFDTVVCFGTYVRMSVDLLVFMCMCLHVLVCSF